MSRQAVLVDRSRACCTVPPRGTVQADEAQALPSPARIQYAHHQAPSRQATWLPSPPVPEGNLGRRLFPHSMGVAGHMQSVPEFLMGTTQAVLPLVIEPTHSWPTDLTACPGGCPAACRWRWLAVRRARCRQTPPAPTAAGVPQPAHARPCTRHHAFLACLPGCLPSPGTCA